MSANEAAPTAIVSEHRNRLMLVVDALTLAAVAVAIPATASLNRWSLPLLGVIALFTVTSDLMGVYAAHRLRITGSFLGLVLASVVLGGGPAAILGVLAICCGWFESRENLKYFLHNLANYAFFPLAAGLVFRLVANAAELNAHAVGYYLLVFATFVLALAINFLGSAGMQCYIERTPLTEKFREAFLPLLSAELFSALLTLVAVFLTHELGVVGCILFGLVLFVFQHLVGELLKSRQRSVALRRAATTDELTGLANRERFREMVESRIVRARGWGGGFPVLLLDLDRFKEVNDTLGHHYGDILLQELGPRLVAAVGDEGLVARLGGDEFGILLAEGEVGAGELEVFLRGLVEVISEPFAVDELSLEVGASIGVARFPADGEDAHALLRCADIAMYTAKEAQTDYKVYAAEQNQHSVRRLSVLSDIRHALASDEIVVHYQPIVDLDDLRVRGAEGLVRWQHPEHGLIPPGAFVQTIEQTGLIGPLTRHVLERSIAECAAWRRAGRELSVAVNLSVRNLLDRDLPRELARLLTTYALPAEALQLEITESMIMSDPERALATVGRLSGLGVRLSVDDFGTGYSSLANLRRMPIDELKIDRSFVSPMLQEENDLIIVRSTINLGHDLGLRVIAEGVEDGATLDELAALGCDLAQGYHVSRPMPADAFTAWLAHTPAHTRPTTTPVPTPAVPTPADPSAAGGPIDLAATLAAPQP